MVQLSIEPWAVPGDGRDQWGTGVLVSPRDTDGPMMYFRFYEWNLFGAVREGLMTQADKSQPMTSEVSEQAIGLRYPDHCVRVEARPRETSIELVCTVGNTSDRTWHELASIVPCFNPGRTPDGTPQTESFADDTESSTYFLSGSGLEQLTGRSIHWIDDYREQIAKSEPEDGFPWDHKWPTAARTASEALIVREGIDGQWATGIAWEDSISVQGHNPWNCMHLSAKIGPLAPGETMTVNGKLYLDHGDKHTIVEQYADDFASADVA